MGVTGPPALTEKEFRNQKDDVDVRYLMRLKVLSILLSITALHGEGFFVYDQPDTNIPVTRLDNPLFYDSSVAISESNTFSTWLEFQPGKGDVIWMGTRDAKGGWIEKQQVTKNPGDYSNPTLTIDTHKNLWLSYEAVTNGQWKIFALRRKANDKTFSPVDSTDGAVSLDNAANVDHRTTSSPGAGVWVVWQGDNNGQFDIWARKIGAEQCAPPMLVSDSPLGDWHPSVTVTPDNHVFVAWDSYNGKSYNIRARESSEGKWGPVINVTSSTNFNANAQIVADKKGRVWISWESDGPNWGKEYRPRTDARKDSQKMSDDIGSLHRFRKLHLAELIASKQELHVREIPQPSFAEAAARTNAPAGIKQLGVFYQSPQLTVDGADRLWIVYRHFYMPMMGITAKTHVQNDWGLYARCLENDNWSKLFRFDEGQGDALQRISVAPQTNGISVAWTFGRTDRRHPQNWVEDKLAPEKVVAHVAKKGASGALEEEGDAPKGKKKKEKKAEPTDGDVASENKNSPEETRGIALATVELPENSSTNAAQLKRILIYRQKIIEKVSAKPPRPAYDFNGKHYELYYGDFHRHTDISLCFWPGDGTMDDAYRYGIDAAPLDFLGVTDHTHDIAMGDPLSLLWQRIRKEVNRHALNGTFIPFYSYERSRGDTDHNVVSLRDDMLRPHTYPHSEFWKELDTNTFTIPHQPFNSVLWKTNDRIHRPLMEIYQGFRNHSCDSDAKEGLASGNEVGFIASSDHLSTGASYACVWAEQPTRESIFRALQARRTFAAMDKTQLRVTCGEHWMGEKFTVKETPQIKIFAYASVGSIDKIEAFVDGEPHPVSLRTVGEFQFVYQMDKSLTGSHTVFIRVTEAGGNKAWSSPMWINIQP
ncbi:MAG: hypothetical protein JWM68_1495 [Verrucomicrobiales bacterium]|nr:hypothetical protein [Verrucomicrobiales bacterium]